MFRDEYFPSLKPLSPVVIPEYFFMAFSMIDGTGTSSNAGRLIRVYPHKEEWFFYYKASSYYLVDFVVPRSSSLLINGRFDDW